MRTHEIILIKNVTYVVCIEEVYSQSSRGQNPGKCQHFRGNESKGCL